MNKEIINYWLTIIGSIILQVMIVWRAVNVWTEYFGIEYISFWQVLAVFSILFIIITFIKNLLKN